MRTTKIIPVTLLLAACVAAGPDGQQPGDVLGSGGGTSAPATTGLIDLTSSTPAAGSVRTEIYPNDVAHVTTRNAAGGNPVISRVALAPGSFARARAVVEARMPSVGVVDRPGCPTGSAASVYVDPPVGGRDQIGTQCPDTAVQDLQRAVLQAIGR